MKRRCGKILKLLMVLTALLLTMTGCLFTNSVSDLYALPKMPKQYQELEQQIKDLISNGAEYAAPISGNNLQPVQMVDLNDDGLEEALIFMRDSASEKPLKIYIFRMLEGHYQCTSVLENSGSSIYSISYVDLTDDGKMEIMVGWRAGAENPVLTVYAMQGDTPELLLSTTYSRYVFDSAGRGFVLLRSGSEERCVVEAYEVSENGTLGVDSAVRLSSTAAELAGGNMISGCFSDGVPALFVTGVSADGSTAMVDALRWEEEGLKNVTMSSATGYTTESYAFRGLFPQDVNRDGVTEIPEPLPAEDVGEMGLVQWRQLSERGRSELVLQTYHDLADGWYLDIPQQWQGKVTAYRSEAGSDETKVTFCYHDGTQLQEFLRIYTFGGENREVHANRGGRFRLSTQQNTVFAGELLPEAPQELALGEEQVRALFHLIITEWVSGEN